MAAQIFNQYTTIVNPGVSGNLMKVSAKRRRSKVQIQEEKEAVLKKELEVQQKMAAWSSMEQEVARLRQQVNGDGNMRSQVQVMLDDGLIKQVADNKWELITDQQEAESQRSHMSEMK